MREVIKRTMIRDHFSEVDVGEAFRPLCESYEDIKLAEYIKVTDGTAYRVLKGDPGDHRSIQVFEPTQLIIVIGRAGVIYDEE
jgi:hypothetical protein